MFNDVRRIGPENRPDFRSLHCEANGAGWCNCIAWWVPAWDGWEDRTAEENLRLREELFDGGEYDIYLLYRAGKAVASCQVGPRDRLEKLVRTFQLPADPDAWAVTCLFVAPAHRRTGCARELLDGVIADLRARRIPRLEAFPKQGTDPDELWTGPESLFRGAGFQSVGRSAGAEVMRLDLFQPGTSEGS